MEENQWFHIPVYIFFSLHHCDTLRGYPHLTVLGAGAGRRKQVLSPEERIEDLLAQLPVDAQDTEKRGCCYAKVRLEWDSQGNVMTPTLANHQNHLGDFKIDFWLCLRSTKSESWGWKNLFLKMLHRRHCKSAQFGKYHSTRLSPALLFFLQGLYSCGLSLCEQICWEALTGWKQAWRQFPHAQCPHRICHISCIASPAHWPTGSHTCPFPSSSPTTSWL